MDMAPANDDLEHALRRVVSLGTHEEPHRNVLVGSRRTIVDFLCASSEPQTVEAIAETTQLHVNTTRHHLDVLVAADFVDRVTQRPTGRGRPRVLYAPSAMITAPYANLEAHLRTTLAGADADEVAIETARSWAEHAPAPRSADDPDQAVSYAVEALNAVGFQAHSDEVGDTITMTSCPYATLITDHPAICTIHAELMNTLLRDTGQPVTLDKFEVHVRPGVCRAWLTRADVAPEFIATPLTVPVSEEAHHDHQPEPPGNPGGGSGQEPARAGGPILSPGSGLT